MIKNQLKKILLKTPTTRLWLKKQYLHKAFLKNSGWLLSAKNNIPVDANNNPLPWLGYSTIHFLNQKSLNNLSVFEYGSGNSTLWFAQRVKKIVSVEHDKKWFDLMKPKLSNLTNVEYKFKALENNDYETEILKSTDLYDLVIIDGRRRIKCAKNALNKLTDKGLILWDNSDRENYAPGIDYLKQKGFKQIEFWGIAPGMHIATGTSIFYREKNALEI